MNDITEDKLIIGIDLGTRNSCASIWRNKRLEIIPDQYGNKIIPSVVSFYKSAKLIGNNALTLKDVNPLNTIYDIKRIIGRKINDPVIDQLRNIISYNIIDDQSTFHNAIVHLDDSDYTLLHKKLYRPEEICAMILSEIKKMVTKYIGYEVAECIITVPAYFNDAQRQATLDAAKIAEFDVLKIINEPTAAAVAYGFGRKTWKSENGGNIIIYDFGAGTLDVSLMNISNGVFRTLAMSGNTNLGGEDIDYLIMNYAISEFRKKNKIRNLEISNLSRLKLKNASENAKKILSLTDKAIVCVDNFYNGQKLYQVLTKKDLEHICNDLFIMALKPLNDVIESANMIKKDIDEVILVGGSTKIPKIQELILNFFKGTKIKKLTCSLNPDEVVSAGASMYGYIITHASDPISEQLVLLDITPLTLGVETLQKKMAPVIPRNTVIPIKKTKLFSTDTDNQDTVTIKIFEGERRLTKDNFHLGTFELSGFDKGPRGHPIIQITFNIDINGILHVTAYEKKSGVQNNICITSTWSGKGRLSKSDIDKIIEEAKKFEHIDAMYSTKVELIHKINSTCNIILANINTSAFNITANDKKKIKKDIRHIINWLKSKEISSISIDELKKKNKYINKTYVPLIIHAEKKNADLKGISPLSQGVEIYGDDDDNPEHNEYEKIIFNNDPHNYTNEEIKSLKKIISDLGKNIINVVNNPVSNIAENDITTIRDYIESVQIWLYTTPAETTIDFVIKIDEINKFTEEIMKKYDQDKIFEKNDNFTAKDELRLTCLTIKTSINNNFFSLRQDSSQELLHFADETLKWLDVNQNESSDIYQKKIEEFNDLCNIIYDNLTRLNIINSKNISDDDIKSDTESDTESDNEKIISNNINEGIEQLINMLPDKPSRNRR